MKINNKKRKRARGTNERGLKNNNLQIPKSHVCMCKYTQGMKEIWRNNNLVEKY